jgi:protein involved in polysaccharide export with SLBB domain
MVNMSSTNFSRKIAGWFFSGVSSLSLLAGTGCHAITDVHESIPASRMPRHLCPEPREGRTVFPFTALGQQKPVAHIIGPGDQLSVYVFGVVPPGVNETPVLQKTQPINQRYYPPHGSVVGATTGLPVEVDQDGKIELPLIGLLQLGGLTIPEATRAVKQAYRAKEITKEDSERVQVSLITSRVHRVVVMRDDTPSPSVQLVRPGQVDHIHRGSADVVDLPAYENDVLHALAITGGLPGTDAAREIWVFKRAGLQNPHAICPEELQVRTASYHSGDTVNNQVVRIPLTGCPGEELPFRPSDIILEDGDVVYLPRREEYFYVGGLVAGAKIPMPRDEDIDVIEAVALANGSVGGPLGQSGQALASGTPGHMVRPTRVIILREMPDGRQLPIRVDLARAMVDQKERILIQPNDVVMLQFKPGQAMFNGVLNLFNVNVLLNPTQLGNN